MYRLLICLLVVLGIQPLLRLPREIGRLYLGVPLSPSLRGFLFVNVEASSHWPGIQAGLRARDRILRIEGRDARFTPALLPEIAASHREGDPVEVEVLRDGVPLTLTIPLRRYRLAEALELHGLWFLAGITTCLAGWLLFRPPTQLMALALLPIAGLLFAHGNTGYADPRFGSFDFYPLEPMWTYGYSLLGAMLLHLAWRFPWGHPARNRTLSRRALWGLVGLYGLVFVMGTAQELTRAVKWVAANEFLTQVDLALAAVGCGATFVRALWEWVRRPPAPMAARAMATVWGIAALLVLGVGILPFWFSDVGMLLAQFLLSIAVVYPLLLVYAVRQVELVDALKHEAAEKQRWAELAQETQRFRERDLRWLAHELHDTVLADLRAVGLRLERLLPSGAAPAGDGERRSDAEGPLLTDELRTLHEAVERIQQQAREVVAGAMPLDFRTTGLREALEDALERFRRMAPEVEARLEVGAFDAEPPPAVREAAYWIAMSALNNCHEHARASEVRVFVSVTRGNLEMAIRDNGIGFPEAEEQESRGARGLGLRNMRARAAAVGGELRVESGPWGTAVRFSLAQGPPMRVLVVEDSEAFVDGLRAGLDRWSHEVELVGAAGDAQTALALAQRLRPDIVLLDLRIAEAPGAGEADARHGLWVLFALRRVRGVRSVVMSFLRHPGWLRAAARAGAWAFWHKDQEVSVLVGLLRQVMAGQRLLTPEGWGDAEAQRLAEALKPREWEVLLCLDQGLSNQEIAERLGLSARTVEKYVESLRGKLGARSRLEAVARARALGLLAGEWSEPGFEEWDAE